MLFVITSNKFIIPTPSFQYHMLIHANKALHFHTPDSVTHRLLHSPVFVHRLQLPLSRRVLLISSYWMADIVPFSPHIFWKDSFWNQPVLTPLTKERTFSWNIAKKMSVFNSILFKPSEAFDKCLLNQWINDYGIYSSFYIKKTKIINNTNSILLNSSNWLYICKSYQLLTTTVYDCTNIFDIGMPK